MKLDHKLIAVSLFFLLLSSSLAISADPFMGEGKQNYIERCISDGEFPDLSADEIRKFCTCMANKLEENYDKILKIMQESNDPYKAQKKAEEVIQQAGKECMEK